MKTTVYTLVLLLLVTPSFAHIELISPQPRHANKYVIKNSPCGLGGVADVRGTRVTTFRPGETITVTWHEYIGHPGHYRIQFSADGVTFPDLPTGPTDLTPRPGELTAPIPDKTGTQMYSEQVTLPNMECDRCALRLVQVMTDKQANGWGNDEFYYACADLTLKTETMNADMSTVPVDMAGPARDLAEPTVDLASASPDSPTGGCNVAGATANPLAAAPFGLLLALAWRRRRTPSGLVLTPVKKREGNEVLRLSGGT